MSFDSPNVMPETKAEEILKTEEKIKPSLNKKWLLVGILVAVLNPIFAGLILGAAYLSEPDLKREGKIVAFIALIWGVFLLYYYKKHSLVIF